MNPDLDRRTLLKLAALGTAAVPLAACGGGDKGAGNGHVKFQGWDFESQLVQDNINRFTQLNPEIPVDYTPITSAQYVQKMVAQFTAGTEPDALYVYDDSLSGWIGAGYLQPLDGMPGLDKVYDGIYTGNAQTMTFEGKRYGLPYYTDSQCLIYNADILNRAGISAPPKTLEELERQALKIRSAGILEHPIGVTAQQQDTWWAWWWGLAYASGATLFDDQLAPVMNTTDTATRDVLTWLQDATTKSKVVDPAVLQLLPIPMDNAFMAGQYAYVIAPRYAARKYNNQAQSKIAGKARLALLPSLDGRTESTVSNTRMYCLTKNTHLLDKAYQLIYYLGGYDNDGKPYTAKYWFAKQGLGFAFKDMAKDPEVRSLLATFADPTVYAHLAEIARPRNVIATPWYTQYEAEQQKVIQRVMTQQATPAAAVQSLADTATALKKQYE